jgi:hypothetical protein
MALLLASALGCASYDRADEDEGWGVANRPLELTVATVIWHRSGIQFKPKIWVSPPSKLERNTNRPPVVLHQLEAGARLVIDQISELRDFENGPRWEVFGRVQVPGVGDVDVAIDPALYRKPSERLHRPRMTLRLESLRPVESDPP